MGRMLGPGAHGVACLRSVPCPQKRRMTGFYSLHGPEKRMAAGAKAVEARRKQQTPPPPLRRRPSRSPLPSGPLGTAAEQARGVWGHLMKGSLIISWLP